MKLQSKIAEFWELERSNRILFLPVWLGLGIGIYFLLPTEPFYAPILAAALILLGFSWRWRLVLPLALAMLGAGVAGFWTAKLHAPILEKALYNVTVEGDIAELEYREKAVRLVLNNLVMDQLPTEKTPRKLTLNIRNKALAESLELGDRIRVKAGFYPPPLPALPGGFQFNRHFYFQQIGGMGFMTSKTPVEVLEHHESDSFMSWINTHRLAIFRELVAALGDEEGAVAAALMVGHQKAISDAVNESMRLAGLSHVLSISGAHLGLAAGIFFFLVRFVFALIPPLALNSDSKILAAIIALMGAFAYLLLAGMPVPAVRSYVMVAMVLLAVLLDRMVTPLRSLALAAILILLYAPESILSPSFQLSFAATVGILAYYEHWRKRDFEPVEHGWRVRVSRFFGGVFMTSLIATLATTPFILHHFDNLAVYGLLGNLLAMPILSFWIMPLIVAALLLLPFGAAGLVFPLLGYGIEAMLTIARFVGSLPMATISLPPLGMEALVLITLCGLWLCLMQQRWRWWSLAGILLGLSTMLFFQPPDLILSDDGKKLAIRTSDDHAVMVFGRKSGFTQDQWLRYLRVQDFVSFKQYQKTPDEALSCDAQACVLARNAKRVALLKRYTDLKEECAEKPDMILLPTMGARREACEGVRLISRWQLQDNGGMAIWLNDDAIRMKTVRGKIGQRPWSQVLITQGKSGSLSLPEASAHPDHPSDAARQLR